MLTFINARDVRPVPSVLKRINAKYAEELEEIIAKKFGGAVPFSRVFELLPRCYCGGLLIKDSDWRRCEKYEGCTHRAGLRCVRCGRQVTLSGFYPL